MHYAIQTEDLSKQYGKHWRVNSVNLKVPAGSVYGFLGPNGAGKSTTIKMILGLVKPSRGRVMITGTEFTARNRVPLLRKTGSLIESPSFYGHLSGYENLDIVSTLKNTKKSQLEEVLAVVRLGGQKDKKVSQYSLGMKQRLGIAAALLGQPEILILDEPTNGLDPAGIQEIRELLMGLPERYEMTVLISSHLLSEIDQMASEVGIIDQGQLIYQDSLASLHEMEYRRIRIRTLHDPSAWETLKKQQVSCTLTSDGILLPYMEDSTLAHVTRLLAENGASIVRVEEQKRNLEDIFLDLTERRVSL